MIVSKEGRVELGLLILIIPILLRVKERETGNAERSATVARRYARKGEGVPEGEGRARVDTPITSPTGDSRFRGASSLRHAEKDRHGRAKPLLSSRYPFYFSFLVPRGPLPSLVGST